MEPGPLILGLRDPRISQAFLFAQTNFLLLELKVEATSESRQVLKMQLKGQVLAG